jgi:hypothetical protein
MNLRAFSFGIAPHIKYRPATGRWSHLHYGVQASDIDSAFQITKGGHQRLLRKGVVSILRCINLRCIDSSFLVYKSCQRREGPLEIVAQAVMEERNPVQAGLIGNRSELGHFSEPRQGFKQGDLQHTLFRRSQNLFEWRCRRRCRALARATRMLARLSSSGIRAIRRSSRKARPAPKRIPAALRPNDMLKFLQRWPR